MQVVFGGRGRGELAVHVGLVLTLVGVTCLLAEVVLPTLFPGWDATTYWLVAAWVALADGLAGRITTTGTP